MVFGLDFGLDFAEEGFEFGVGLLVAGEGARGFCYVLQRGGWWLGWGISLVGLIVRRYRRRVTFRVLSGAPPPAHFVGAGLILWMTSTLAMLKVAGIRRHWRAGSQTCKYRSRAYSEPALTAERGAVAGNDMDDGALNWF